MASSSAKKLANAQAASLAAQVANMAAQLEFQKERMRLLELPQFQHLSQMDIDKLAFEKSQAEWENALKEATISGTYKGQPTMQYLEQQAKLFGVIDGQQTLEGKLSDAQIAQINHAMQLQSHASQLEDQKFGFERERWGKEFDYQMQKDLRDFGVTEAQLTGMYNGQQTLASKELDSKNTQAYLSLLGSLQGPGNAFKQMRVLGSTPQGLKDMVGQWTGQYQAAGLTGTGQAPGQAQVSDLFDQSYAQQFMGTGGGTGQPQAPPAAGVPNPAVGVPGAGATPTPPPAGTGTPWTPLAPPGPAPTPVGPGPVVPYVAPPNDDLPPYPGKNVLGYDANGQPIFGPKPVAPVPGSDPAAPGAPPAPAAPGGLVWDNLDPQTQAALLQQNGGQIPAWALTDMDQQVSASAASAAPATTATAAPVWTGVGAAGWNAPAPAPAPVPAPPSMIDPSAAIRQAYQAMSGPTPQMITEATRGTTAQDPYMPQLGPPGQPSLDRTNPVTAGFNDPLTDEELARRRQQEAAGYDTATWAAMTPLQQQQFYTNAAGGSGGTALAEQQRLALQEQTAISQQLQTDPTLAQQQFAQAPVAAQPETPPSGEQGYTVSPAGTQAPIGAYNYEATPSGQTQVYPPGVAAPVDSAQTSTSTPQSMSGNVGLLPSQINAENYENSNEYAKQFLWGYLENEGWDPIAAQSAYQKSLPKYGGPASGTVNAGLGM